MCATTVMSQKINNKENSVQLSLQIIGCFYLLYKPNIFLAVRSKQAWCCFHSNLAQFTVKKQKQKAKICFVRHGLYLVSKININPAYFLDIHFLLFYFLLFFHVQYLLSSCSTVHGSSCPHR
jgi:hypothetical protein